MQKKKRSKVVAEKQQFDLYSRYSEYNIEYVTDEDETEVLHEIGYYQRKDFNSTDER